MYNVVTDLQCLPEAGVGMALLNAAVTVLQRHHDACFGTAVPECLTLDLPGHFHGQGSTRLLVTSHMLDNTEG